MGDPATHTSDAASIETPMHLGLDGKVAIVTGASRGIGAAIADVLAREGVDLFLVARSGPDLEAAAAALRSVSRCTVTLAAVDLRGTDAGADVVRQAIAAFGRLDILINCAGDTRSKHFFDATDEDWMDAFAVKLHGAVRLTRSAWPHLRTSRGCIVNIAGNTARSAHADLAINGAVNAALVHLTKSLSDIGRRDGVRVNAINPGRTRTRRLDRALDRVSSEHSVDRGEAARKLLATAGIPRFCEPREIAWLAAFLASPRADFIQGAVVDIDGGETRAV